MGERKNGEGDEIRNLNKELFSAQRDLKAKLGGGFGLGVAREFTLRGAAQAFGIGSGVLLAVQAVRALGREFKQAGDFEAEIANVSTLLGGPDAQRQLEILRAQILKLPPALGSATELTRALYQALSAGAKPAEAVQLVAEAAIFAKASLADARSSIDVITSVLNAYGISAKDAAKVTSTLLETVRLGKTTGPELAGALGRVLPVAAAMSVSLQQVSAAIATLTLGGLSTEESVVALRQALASILSPSSAAEKAAAALGLNFGKMRDEVKSRGLLAVLGEMAQKTKGNAEATSELFGNVRALVGVLSLTGAQAGKYTEVLRDLEAANRDGTATQIAFEKQTSSVNAKFEELANTVKRELAGAFIVLAPAIKAVFEELRGGAGILGATGVNFTNLARLISFSAEGFLLMAAGIQNLSGVVLAGLAKIRDDLKFMGPTGLALHFALPSKEALDQAATSAFEGAEATKKRILDIEDGVKKALQPAGDFGEAIGGTGKNSAASNVDRLGVALDKAGEKISVFAKHQQSLAFSLSKVSPEALIARVDKAGEEGLRAALKQGARLKFGLPSGELPEIPSFLGRSTTEQLKDSLASLAAKQAQGADTTKREIADRKQLSEALMEEISLRLKAGVVTDEQRDKIESLTSELNSNREALRQLLDAQNASPLERTITILSNIVGKFSGGLSESFSAAFSTFESLNQLGKDFNLTMQGIADQEAAAKGNIPVKEDFKSGVDGIRQMLSSWESFKKSVKKGGLADLVGIAATVAANFRQSLAAGIGASLQLAAQNVKDPLAKAILEGAGIAVQLLESAFTAAARRISKQIISAFNGVINNFNSGSLKLSSAMMAVEAQRADAVERLSGRKGGRAELDKILPSFDQAIAGFKRQVKEVFDSFDSALANLKLPEGLRDIGKSIADITKNIQTFLDAGGDSLRAQSFLALSLRDVYKTTSAEINEAERDTISLLQQSIALAEEREKVLADSADQKLQIRLRQGLGTLATPAQIAALELKAVREARAAKLKDLDTEQKRLDAQLGGKQTLFSLQKDTNSLLAEEFRLTKLTTQDFVTRIKLLQSFLTKNKSAFAAALASPLSTAIPNLPGFAGNIFQAGDINITGPIYLTATPGMTGKAAWEMFKQGLSYGSTQPGGPLKQF